MLRILRAFVWLRWRTLLNSLERRGSRDVLERFSIAFEQLAPAIAALVMVPAIISLAGLSAFAGWSLSQQEPGFAIEILRFLLFAACALAVAGPIMLPGGDRTNAVRLLLLPIPRGVLYLGHAMGAIADPWVLLAGAVAVGLPLGLAAGGSGWAAASAVIAGLLLLATLIGIALAVTSAVHLIVRDRRRGELMALAVVIILPMLGLLPALLAGSRHSHPASMEPRRSTAIERMAFGMVPSELYVQAVRSSSVEGPQPSAAPLGTLLLLGAAFHAAAFMAFVRVLSSPGMTGPARGRGRTARRWRIPGLSPGVSAVAINQLRLAFRTPRGRATLLSPVVVFGMFTAMALRSGSGSGSFGPLVMRGGPGMAAFSALVSLMALLPVAMNQFAVDRAGLTMAMLAPLETRALLRGKAVGNAAIALIPGVICFAGAIALFPGGDPAVWACIPLVAVATYVLVAPVAAILSAVFPKAVDLNSIGSGSNAHGAAGLLGMLSFVLAAAAGGLIAAVTGTFSGRPALAPLAVAIWILVALVASAALFRVAAGVFERRRENLGLTSRADHG
jgi:hypothetical protein